MYYPLYDFIIKDLRRPYGNIARAADSHSKGRQFKSLGVGTSSR